MQHNGWDHDLKVTVDGTGPSGPPGTGPGRRAPAVPDRIARARAKARPHALTLIEATAAGFPGWSSWVRR